jgi:HAD superfamily hydrolase (TIGR01509 family)
MPIGFLFDMDGTLTAPMLDFPRIKAEMGIGDRPILEAMEEMSPQQRIEANAVLLRHEQQAAERSSLNPGCRELLDWIDSRGWPTALITRNSRLSAQTVLERHGLRFHTLVTREDSKYKPDPAPLRCACERLKVNIAEAWMIGDGQYDIEAGVAAGCRTVWLSHGRQKFFAAEPWRTVDDLHELASLLKEHYP